MMFVRSALHGVRKRIFPRTQTYPKDTAAFSDLPVERRSRGSSRRRRGTSSIQCFCVVSNYEVSLSVKHVAILYNTIHCENPRIRG
jgi:hypothetical protein